jgi:uroporphyrinogen III methyltransferase/synthase
MADSPAVGKVYLVGAGPGDPGLITVKGYECLGRAEVIVYDRLAADEFLQAARPEAELIYCGKSPDRHELTQEQINQTLVEHALAGKCVCRLKGGDPFVFGRGGEEALELHRHGIPFEVVPGVTSAIAAPAYAGIPVTHRAIATSFAVVTGHEDPTKPEGQVQWQRLATATDTLVILMGVGNLGGIVEGLLAGGRASETPVALVNWGTHPEQRTLVSSLGAVVHDAEVAGARSPSVIVVGEVVGLRPELAWFDNRPLFGLTGLVTRTRHQASDLSCLLRQHGATPLEMPVIRLAPPESWEPVDDALAVADSFDWVVFTSANGVAMLQEHLAEIGSDIRALKGPRVAAIGPATAAAARAAGLHVALCPEEYVAEALVEALAAEGLAGQRLLLLRAAQARDVLPDQARAAGAEVVIAPVYQTLPVESLDPEIVARLEKKQVDFVTFASSSSVKYFVEALGVERTRALLDGICVGCIGPITAATARELGLSPTVVPDEYTIEALVTALVEYYERRKQKTEDGRRDVAD